MFLLKSLNSSIPFKGWLYYIDHWTNSIWLTNIIQMKLKYGKVWRASICRHEPYFMTTFSSRGLPHIELDQTINFFRKVNVSNFRICNFRSQNVMSLLKIDPEIIIQTIVNDPKYLKISEMDQNWIKQQLFKSVDVVS